MREQRFLIERDQWLALTCYLGSGGVHPSPIRVDGVERVAGARAIDLTFLHLAYAAGAQIKRYRLRTLKRTAAYYAAEQVDEQSGEANDRLIVIEKLTGAWMQERFPDSTRNLKRLFDQSGKPSGDEFIGIYGASY